MHWKSRRFEIPVCFSPYIHGKPHKELLTVEQEFSLPQIRNVPVPHSKYTNQSQISGISTALVKSLELAFSKYWLCSVRSLSPIYSIIMVQRSRCYLIFVKHSGPVMELCVKCICFKWVFRSWLPNSNPRVGKLSV